MNEQSEYVLPDVLPTRPLTKEESRIVTSKEVTATPENPLVAQRRVTIANQGGIKLEHPKTIMLGILKDGTRTAHRLIPVMGNQDRKAGIKVSGHFEEGTPIELKQIEYNDILHQNQLNEDLKPIDPEAK